MGIVDYIKDRRILAFILLVLLFAGLDLIYGIHLGTEFSGGVEIPIYLTHTTDALNMSLLVSAITERVSLFGLSNPTVEQTGPSEVTVTVSNASQSAILGTVKIIESQGVFQGIVGGREAINGSGIETESITPSQPQVVPSTGTVEWEVTFQSTEAAAARFAKVAYGQTNQPLYLFLDRPTKAVLLINSSILLNPPTLSDGQTLTSAEYQTEMEQAVAFGNQSIPIQFLNANLSNWNVLYKFFSANNKRYNTVILAVGTPNSIIENLTSLNYTITQKSISNMTPQVQPTNATLGTSVVNAWSAIGLVTAPTLVGSTTSGIPNPDYLINGFAPSNLTYSEKINFSNDQARTITTILKGGALPVSVIVGEPTLVPPTLGKQAAIVSGVAAILAVLAVTAVIVIRYRKAFLIGPIILTTLGELFIIASILGIVGGIDLAAVAGMIAVVGTGVDAQIIISDEILVQHSESGTMRSKLNRAFYVVWADAALLCIAMLPLLFSTTLLTVIGFAESTLIGALLGAIITRPAYGSIISRHYSKGSNA